MAASVSSAEVWNLDSGEIEIWDAERLGFGYRHSNISPRHVVLSAVLTLREGDSDEGREELREIVRWRREHQPGGANAGSVFQNPDSVSAGAVIDACGLKGRRHGSAHVSEKHANFIMVDVPGSAEDVVALMDEVRECVARERGVELHSEIRLVGF
jgi:UDP-N-acetylmuramate dehydrogenase